MSTPAVSLNDFIAAHIAPVMREGGFRKTGRRSWQIEAPGGLKTNVQVSNYPSGIVTFHVRWEVVPQSVDDYFTETGESRAAEFAGVIGMPWPSPAEESFVSDLWDVREESELEDFARTVEDELRNNAVPFWRSIDHRLAADLVRRRGKPPGFGRNEGIVGPDLGVALVGLYTEDPVEMLTYVDAATYDDRPIKDWIRAKLLARLESTGTQPTAEHPQQHGDGHG